MATQTVPPHLYSSLLYDPPSGPRKDAKDQLPRMKFDPDHYTRAYMLCKGGGFTSAQCKSRLDTMVDTYITPQNPTEQVFSRELVDAMECMATHGDEKKCKHHFEGMYNLLHPPPRRLSSRLDTLKKIFGVYEKPQ